MGLLTAELDNIISQKDKILARIAGELYSELEAGTPTGKPSEWKNPNSAPKGYVGGHLKGSWTIEQKGKDWIINNPVEYAEIRLSPYANNGQIGSKQYPAGIYPIINKYKRKLQDELDRI